ncbi:MAG: sulfatase-like hydrolase/transferase [Candidatus Sumerlaeota bacterium]|nr:sulfatase-like hydrolase/transferase [Candidatus Sumerlaeota bacterium]
MSAWTRRDLLKVAGLGGMAAMAAPRWLRTADAPRKPNIILFLCDDVGLDLIGCYGSDKYKGQTPHIDTLAKTGLRFDIAYSAPLCGPTRCLINTGRYAFRTGGLTNQSWGGKAEGGGGKGAKSGDEFPIARMMKQAGYATCSAGKWRQVGETPGDWGYDEWITDQTAGGWYWQSKYTKNGKLVETAKEEYCPDVYHEFAMDFVKRHKDGPFFLYYPTHLVHAPILKTPDSKPNEKDFYADNVAYMDKLLGKVVAEIDRLGIRENTLILFAGDNGTARQSGAIGGRQINGAKGSMMEGGARVPFIANWKGVTPEGKVCKDMVDFSDYHATFAELAGTTQPANLPFDGHSFAPQLRGQPGQPREWIFVQLGARWYVRERNWKMTQAGELLDMKEAPFEEKPVPADTKDEEAIAARRRLQAALDKLNPAGGKTEAGGGKKAGLLGAAARLLGGKRGAQAGATDNATTGPAGKLGKRKRNAQPAAAGK